MINKALSVRHGGFPECEAAGMVWHRSSERSGVLTLPQWWTTSADKSLQCRLRIPQLSRISPSAFPSCSARPIASCAAVEVLSGFAMLELVGRHLRGESAQ